MAMGFEMFGIIERLFPIVFIAVLVVILLVIIKGILQWSKNNKSPVITVEARVVNMRVDTRIDRHFTDADNMVQMYDFTQYFVTFEVESGSRMELRVSGQEYGMLAQGDVGKLTFQGTRYLGFQRKQEAQ